MTAAIHVCLDCGQPHTRERRAAVLRRILPAMSTEILAVYRHLFRTQKMLTRDLHELGAKRMPGGEWGLPDAR